MARSTEIWSSALVGRRRASTADAGFFAAPLSRTTVNTITRMATMISAVNTNAMRSPAMERSSTGMSGNKNAEVAERETRMAVPSEAPTWFNVFCSAFACWITRLSSEFRPQVFSGVMMACMPTPRQVYTKMMNGTGVSSAKPTRPHPPMAAMAAPGMITRRGPSLSNRRPAK